MEVVRKINGNGWLKIQRWLTIVICHILNRTNQEKFLALKVYKKISINILFTLSIYIYIYPKMTNTIKSKESKTDNEDKEKKNQLHKPHQLHL